MSVRSISDGNNEVYWYIMFHPKPDVINMYLGREKARRAKDHDPDFTFIVPYLFLRHIDRKDKVSAPNEDRTKGWLKRKDERHQQLKDEVVNNSLRNYLHYFVFIKSTRYVIDELLHLDWNVNGLSRLSYRYTHSGEPLFISDVQMQPLLRTLAVYQQKFSLTDFSANTLSVGNVEIKVGPYAGTTASVLKVRKVGDDYALTLGIPVFNREFMLTLNNFPAKDVRVMGGSISTILQPYFISEFEKDLLRILRMRVRRQEDVVLRKENLSTLDSYSSVSQFSFEQASHQKHFCALKLLYAVLLREAQLKAACLDSVKQILSGIETPSSDEDAFLFAILFVATRKGAYRKAVKIYVQTHGVQLPSLKALLPVLKDINTR